MRTQAFALLAAGLGALAQDTNATVVSDNPPDARYIARFEGDVAGRVLAGSDAFGLGVNFHVALDGLSVDQGPFGMSDPLPSFPQMSPCSRGGNVLLLGAVVRDANGAGYFLNQDPVPEDGNCTGTGARLDPFGRTDDPPCDDGEPQSCMVGDLSGKYGAVEGPRDEIR